MQRIGVDGSPSLFGHQVARERGGSLGLTEAVRHCGMRDR
jgi:hypothetical protein